MSDQKQCGCGQMNPMIATFCGRCGVRAGRGRLVRWAPFVIILLVAVVAAFMLGRISVDDIDDVIASEPVLPGASKRDDIYALLRMMQLDRSMEKVIHEMRNQYPDTPQEAWDELVRSAGTNEFIIEMIPPYEKHMSHADVRALLAFYRTPAGQRFLLKSPEITADSFAVGQAWGQKLERQIAKKLGR
jgi:hypothetical protein